MMVWKLKRPPRRRHHVGEGAHVVAGENWGAKGGGEGGRLSIWSEPASGRAGGRQARSLRRRGASDSARRA